MTYPIEKQQEVVNWIIEQQKISNNRLAGRKTAEEAIEHFNLDTKPSNVEAWMRKFGVGKKQTLTLAKKNYLDSTLEYLKETSGHREALMKRGLNKLYDDKSILTNDKAMSAINNFKKAIDGFTGVEDLKALLEMNLDDSKLKLKKTESKYKTKLAQLEINLKEKEVQNCGTEDEKNKQVEENQGDFVDSLLGGEDLFEAPITEESRTE